MKFTQYLLTEEDYGNSSRVESLTGTLRAGKFIDMISKKGQKFRLYGAGIHSTEGPVIQVKIEIFNAHRSHSQTARLSFRDEEDIRGITYYAYINTDDSDEMDSALNNLFE